MRVIRARNINDAWMQAKELLNQDHVARPSRVGDVWECTEPVTTLYKRPLERVLFNPERNANHIFHLMEALWCLAGRNRIGWLEQFNGKIRDFVGKADEQHGAYGYRWRYFFDMDGGAEDGYADQLQKIIRMLRKDPNERRAVLTMWSPLADLERPDIADVPCNTQCYFKIRNGALDIVVTCRSNDTVFGCYGSNIVQFSILLEYMAAMIGVPVGRYWQVSDSWHAYTSRWKEFGGFSTEEYDDYYSDQKLGLPGIAPYALVEDADLFDGELNAWMNRDTWVFETGFANSFFPLVAEPLYLAWKAYKNNDLELAFKTVVQCEAEDWRIGAMNFFENIRRKRQAKGIWEAK